MNFWIKIEIPLKNVYFAFIVTLYQLNAKTNLKNTIIARIK